MSRTECRPLGRLRDLDRGDRWVGTFGDHEGGRVKVSQPSLSSPRQATTFRLTPIRSDPPAGSRTSLLDKEVNPGPPGLPGRTDSARHTLGPRLIRPKDSLVSPSRPTVQVHTGTPSTRRSVRHVLSVRPGLRSTWQGCPLLRSFAVSGTGVVARLTVGALDDRPPRERGSCPRTLDRVVLDRPWHVKVGTSLDCDRFRRPRGLYLCVEEGPDRGVWTLQRVSVWDPACDMGPGSIGSGPVPRRVKVAL